MHNVAIRTGTEEHRLIVSGAITLDGIRRVMVSSTCVSPDRLLTLLPELDDGLHEYCSGLCCSSIDQLRLAKNEDRAGRRPGGARIRLPGVPPHPCDTSLQTFRQIMLLECDALSPDAIY